MSSSLKLSQNHLRVRQKLERRIGHTLNSESSDKRDNTTDKNKIAHYLIDKKSSKRRIIDKK